MRLSRTQIIAGLTLLLTLAIAFLTGIVNSYIPLPWIQSHIWLVLVLLALFIVLELFFTIKGAASNNSISQIKEDQFNDFLKTVSDAESEAQVDPDFEHTPFIAKQALAITSPPNDLGTTLECYEALGEIALNEENDANSAYNWYLQQLHLAERTIRPPHQVSAHRGLARTLLIKNTPDDIKQAYRHAREALGFEDKESNKNELYIFLVHIADLLLYQH